MTIDPLPTHNTRVGPPPLEGVHLIKSIGDEIFMMGWDGEASIRSVCMRSQTSLDIPMTSRSLGHLDLS